MTALENNETSSSLKQKAKEYFAYFHETHQELYKNSIDDETAAARLSEMIPMPSRDGEADPARTDPARDVMEEIGYIPWCFEGLTTSGHDRAFTYLNDPAHFLAPYGITTADMAHPGFMRCTARHGCLWDGPVWPFATSQALTGLYTLLRTRKSDFVNAEDFMKHLHTYAASQRLYKDGRVIPWIDENLEPFTGQWISRDLIMLDHFYKDSFPAERGAEYNHSTFCDLVLSGTCGYIEKHTLSDRSIRNHSS